MGCFIARNDLNNNNFDQQYIKKNESNITTRNATQNRQVNDDSNTEQNDIDSIIIEFNSENRSKFSQEDFNFLSVLGYGTFGKVYLVQNKATSKISNFIRKLIQPKQKQQLQTERKILERMFHPFIVNLCFAFQTPRQICFGTEVVMGGELFLHMQKSGTFSEKRTKFYIAQLVLALEYLHVNGIIYRDLKPENILLEKDGYIKITDFGLSKEGMTDQQMTYTFCGTPEYLAPEIIFGQGYNHAVDWWSLGILLYEMLSGQSPFQANTTLQTFQKIIDQKINVKPYFSEQVQSLIQGLLDPNPKTRLGGSSNDASQIKQHPFFNSIDWNKLYNKQYSAPYKPEITNPIDIRNFDPHFTKEPIKDTLSSFQTLINSQTEKLQSFTFIKHSLLQTQRRQEEQIESRDWLEEDY